jgi:hypothetical protein
MTQGRTGLKHLAAQSYKKKLEHKQGYGLIQAVKSCWNRKAANKV